MKVGSRENLELERGGDVGAFEFGVRFPNDGAMAFLGDGEASMHRRAIRHPGRILRLFRRARDGVAAPFGGENRKPGIVALSASGRRILAPSHPTDSRRTRPGRRHV